MAAARDADPRRHDDALAERILTSERRITVVGASGTAGKPAHDVPLRMRSRGYEIVPVNPTLSEWEGVPAHPSLQEVKAPGIVDVFRRSEEAPQIVRDAIAAGAKAVWLQLGITSIEARRIAEEAGIFYLDDRCVNEEYERLARNGAALPRS